MMILLVIMLMQKIKCAFYHSKVCHLDAMKYFSKCTVIGKTTKQAKYSTSISRILTTQILNF
ncbi:Uncharacterised protein [Vibrio cholerae]|nr:Uncharacterised protein [Vibrio cholerae]